MYDLNKIFKLPHEPYTTGERPYGHNERVVEIPWALSSIQDAKKVLDVGFAYGEGRYLEPLCKMKIQELHGVDKGRKPRYPGWMDSMIKASADLREELPYDKDYFDVILCVSTIEHVGLSNTMYFTDDHEKDDYGDKKALKNMLDILKPNGWLVLTVPYGKGEVQKQFKNYDRSMLDDLIKSQDCKVVREDLFYYQGSGWKKGDDVSCRNCNYGKFGFSSASGLACLLITKGI